jgi:hypothetical protein
VNWELSVSIVSVVIAGLALLEAIQSRRKAERSARSADAAAVKAAEAAERSASAAERSADALQRSAAISEADARRSEEVTWSLKHFQGDTYILKNESRTPAHSVLITTGDLMAVRGELEHELIDGEGYTQFTAARVMGTTDDSVTVTWLSSPAGTDPDAKRQVWRHPLPARLPRR